MWDGRKRRPADRLRVTVIRPTVHTWSAIQMPRNQMAGISRMKMKPIDDRVRTGPGEEHEIGARTPAIAPSRRLVGMSLLGCPEPERQRPFGRPSPRPSGRYKSRQATGQVLAVGARSRERRSEADVLPAAGMNSRWKTPS